jgi:hypothetical protein
LTFQFAANSERREVENFYGSDHTEACEETKQTATTRCEKMIDVIHLTKYKLLLYW